MGIDWSNLGAGLAVWGDVFRDMAERKKKRQRDEKMAQTIGQIMHLSEAARTGEDTTPGVATMMGTNKVDTSPLIESSINSMYRNLPPEMQSEMGMALLSTKQGLLNTANETQFVRQAYEQVGQMMQDDPYMQEALAPAYKLIKDPLTNKEMVKALWNQANQINSSGAMAKVEARAKKDAFFAEEGQELRDAQRKEKLDFYRSKKEIEQDFWKLRQEETNTLKQAEEIVGAWSDIATRRREVANDAHTKYQKAVKELNEFQVDEETVGEIKPLLEQAYKVKSAKVNGEQKEMEITGYELLSSFNKVWESAGKPPVPNQNLVDMAVRNLMEEKTGEAFAPKTGMQDLYDFVYEKMGIENMGSAFRIQDYLDKQQQTDQLRRMAIVEEILSFQRQAIARDLALSAGKVGEASRITNEMQIPSNWRYLDVSSYDYEEGNPATQSIQVKPQYKPDARALTEYLSNPETGRTVDVMSNALSLPIDMAMAIRLLGNTKERGILTDVEREPQQGAMDKWYEKKGKFSNYIGKTGEETSRMLTGVGEAVKGAGKAVKEAVTDVPSEDEAIEAIERQAEAGREGGQGEIKRGLEAKTTPEAITQIKNLFTRELALMDADLVNASAFQKQVRWAYPDNEGNNVVRTQTLDPDDKSEFMTTIEEMLTDEANKVYGINIGRVNLNDPALKEVKDYVENIWSRMW